MSEEQTYESAVERLDQIISRLDSNEAQLRETLDLCAEAKTLIGFCAAELAAVDEGLKELKLDELASSLAPSQPTTMPEVEAVPDPEPVPERTDDDVPF
ncbi:MAG: exodeoxyribonuclease VII small subunit [Solirubrobacterales bacterium]